MEHVAVDDAVHMPLRFPVRHAHQESPLRGHPELTELAPGTLALVEVAVVFEDAFCLDDVAAALGEPVGTLLPAIHELLAADVLVARGETVGFRDAELRAEVYVLVPEPVRATLHRTIGGVLLDRGGCDADAAKQLVKAARPGDRAVLAALDDIAAELVTRSPDAAAELALHALELTEPADDQRVPRAATAAEALVAAGKVRVATELAERTLALARGPDQAAARLRLLLAAVRLLDGDPGPAAILLDQPGPSGHEPDGAQWQLRAVLSDQGRPGPGGGRDEAELVRAVGLLARGDLAAAEATADVLLAGVSGAGPLGVGLAVLAWVAWCRGHLTTALHLGRAAVLRSAQGESPGRLAELALAAMLLAVGELDEAAELLDRPGVPAGPLDALWEPVTLQLAARLQLATGRLDQAVTGSRQVLALAEERGTQVVVPLAHATLAQVAVLRGNLEEAARYDELTPPGTALLPTDRAALAWSRAQLDGARYGPASVLRALTGGSAALPAGLEEPAAVELTRAALAVGDRGLATELAARTERVATGNVGLGSLRVAAEHARGLVDADAARLDRAAEGHRRPWSAASAHEDAGVVLLGAGDRVAARERFERALGSYRRAGAERDAGRVRARLRELGVRACHWSRSEHPNSGWASLTDAERRVAAAVAEGLTNRKAAERLFLSRHTVDFHLRQIFLKLGIRSRVELTRLVVQEPDPAGTT
jgi:DNA-binding CsgD family transcriptional regulator/tetratricopeptide (TPR) repeat protein